MAERIRKASKTRSGRPGWSVTFRHPRRCDARGRYGLRVRRGLGTTDEAEADRIVNDLNVLLGDDSWWSADRRADAEQRLDPIAVAAFFDDIEAAVVSSRDLRNAFIRLPGPDDGYARVMLVGPTGAGKTTLLRQLIGTDHRHDRFPSTSTARTTTAEIEIVTADAPFQAVVTFMTQAEARGLVDECVMAACVSAVEGQDNAGIAGAFLEHGEQRFRLSYVLGAWRQDAPGDEGTNPIDLEYESPDDTEQYGGEEIQGREVVGGDDVLKNNRRLEEYIDRIREISNEIGAAITAARGSFDALETSHARQEWRDDFAGALAESDTLANLSLDVMDDVSTRFDAVGGGDFRRRTSGWPEVWHYENRDRETFLAQVRWFTSNHHRQFGRLLTPLVDGIRVSGPFHPALTELRDMERRLVLLDGEGLGHSARDTSVSTRITERFTDADLILLVDNAESPLLATPLGLLRSVGSSGHGSKLAIAFTHFDQVRGDNLHGFENKRTHVRKSIENGLSSLRDILGPPVTEILSARLKAHDFYLGSLDRPVSKIPGGFVRELERMLQLMKTSATPPVEPVQAAPRYSIGRLELHLRDAADGFKNPWFARLGLSYYEDVAKEHWARIKALCRRVANRWNNDEYGDLRPKADFVRQLQESISHWLNTPQGWTRAPRSDDERQEAIGGIRRQVFERIHELVADRLIVEHSDDWRRALRHSGTESSVRRAKEMRTIYDAAAPSIRSVMDPEEREFLDEVIRIVGDVITEASGTLEGARE